MATIVLGTAGRLIAGPIGGIIGGTIGGVIDNGLFGGGRATGRQANLALQSAAYGEPIAVVTGRMRVAGNLLWSSGINESTAGGGKSGGTSYSYSASFAVGLAGRAIRDVARIWADGKLIRDGSGAFLSPTIMRLHPGDEWQEPDPLIAAAEGEDGTPAYRGIAYAVFENLPLADHGNRIPNLTFEIIADDPAGHDAGQAIAALAQIEGRPVAAVEGSFPAFSGYAAGQGGSVADALAPLLDIAGAAVVGEACLVVRGAGGLVRSLPADQCQTQLSSRDRRRDRRKLFGGERRYGAVEITYYDNDRDYQEGIQRVRRDASAPVNQQFLPCAMPAGEAKALAASLLARSEARRWQLEVRLPWRYLSVKPGDRVVIEGQTGIWRVRQARFEAFVVHLELERESTEAVPPVGPADSGRAAAFADIPAGPTTLAVFELPALPGDDPAVPRLWIAAAGESPGWRRAAVEVSLDGGESFGPAGVAAAATPLGLAVTALTEGTADLWDRHGSVEIELLSELMWLESRSETSVLAGANLALLGAEIFQFANVEALGPRRFRLSGLLRGRLGTEAAIAGHTAGERFVLLDRAMLLPFDPSLAGIGRPLRFRTADSVDAVLQDIEISPVGRALTPLSPAHLQLVPVGEDVVARWIRRSRIGFAWSDFVDVPLGEAEERYHVSVWLGDREVRSVEVAIPEWTYTGAQRLADGGGEVVTIAVAQLSAGVGPGQTAYATLWLENEKGAAS